MTTSDASAAASAASGTPPALQRLAVPAVLLGSLATALSAIFIKLSELPPTATGFSRLFLSAPILLIWLGWERPRHAEYQSPKSWRDRFKLTLAASFYGLNTGVWCWCMKYTSVANGQLIANISPIFVMVVAFLFLREHITGTFLAGLALTLAGVALLMGQSSSLGGAQLYGDLLALAGSFCWTAYLLSIQSLRKRFSTATIMTWTAVVSSVLLLAVALAAGERLVPTTVQGWAAVLGLAFISQVAGQSLITFALPQLPVSFTALALLMQPIYAALVAWPVLGERPTLVQVAGGAIVLSGIALARPRRRR